MRIGLFFLAGLALGFGGWLLVPKAESVRDTRHLGSNGVRSDVPGSHPGSAKPANRRPAWSPRGPDSSSAALTAQLLAKAHRERNADPFLELLHRLGESNSPESRAVLRDILVDQAYRFPPGADLGPQFAHWLAGAGTDDALATGARMRYERALAGGDRPVAATRGWFDLVATHGDADDVAWLLARNESPQVTNAARRALVISPDDSAHDALIGLHRARALPSRMIIEAAPRAPERTAALLARALPLERGRERFDWGFDVIALYAGLVGGIDGSERGWRAAEHVARQSHGTNGVVVVALERLRKQPKDGDVAQRTRVLVADALNEIATAAATVPLETPARVRLYGIVDRIIQALDEMPVLKTQVVADRLRTAGLGFTRAERPHWDCQRIARQIENDLAE